MTTDRDLLSQALDDANAARVATDPTPALTGLLVDEPDIVDRIFAFLAEIQPEMFGPGADLAKAKRAVRDEFGGFETYVRSGKRDKSREVAAAVLQHFNGRNASEVARRLHISRATVYRCIKQPGK